MNNSTLSQRKLISHLAMCELTSYLFIYLFIYLFVCLFVYLFIYFQTHCNP